MAGGLFALLDDVAAMAKLAAASVDDVGAAAGRASAKAAGVVVDDTAVTPQYLEGSPPSASCRSSRRSPSARCATSCSSSCPRRCC